MCGSSAIIVAFILYCSQLSIAIFIYIAVDPNEDIVATKCSENDSNCKKLWKSWIYVNISFFVIGIITAVFIIMYSYCWLQEDKAENIVLVVSQGFLNTSLR